MDLATFQAGLARGPRRPAAGAVRPAAGAARPAPVGLERRGAHRRAGSGRADRAAGRHRRRRATRAPSRERRTPAHRPHSSSAGSRSSSRSSSSGSWSRGGGAGPHDGARDADPAYPELAGDARGGVARAGLPDRRPARSEGPRIRYTSLERTPLVETALDLQAQQENLKQQVLDLRTAIQQLEAAGQGGTARHARPQRPAPEGADRRRARRDERPGRRDPADRLDAARAPGRELARLPRVGPGRPRGGRGAVARGRGGGRRERRAGHDLHRGRGHRRLGARQLGLSRAPVRRQGHRAGTDVRLAARVARLRRLRPQPLGDVRDRHLVRGSRPGRPRCIRRLAQPPLRPCRRVPVARRRGERRANESP